jgi:carboxymethylenebutenolidase
VARRLAVAGFAALAPDFLSPLGGTPADGDAAAAMFRNLDINQVNENAIAAVNWLRARPECNGKVGAVGFCWGGDRVGRLAVADPDLKAVVIYYGVAPDPKLAADIKAELLINMPDPKLDPRTTGSMPPFVAALKAAKVRYQIYYYAGANHAFNDDTAGARYDESAAKLAWGRTLALFGKDLA